MLGLGVSEYMSKADEWIEIYIDFNGALDQKVKAEIHQNELRGSKQ